jgi:putative hemolysin
MMCSQPVDAPALSYAAPEDGRLKQAVIRMVERLSGQQRAERIYREVRRGLGPDSNVWAEAVRGLNVKVAYDAARLAAVPSTGPLVVVANHPFGVVDGLVLSGFKRSLQWVVRSSISATRQAPWRAFAN